MVYLPHRYFNSIKVRLKQSAENEREFAEKFQFHKGTIKTFDLKVYQKYQQHFNSIKVRLKRIDFLPINRYLPDFNSIKVRLKLVVDCDKAIQLLYFNSIKVRLKLVLTMLLQFVMRFQFHKGTIKTYINSQLDI